MDFVNNCGIPDSLEQTHEWIPFHVRVNQKALEDRCRGDSDPECWPDRLGGHRKPHFFYCLHDEVPHPSTFYGAAVRRQD